MQTTHCLSCCKQYPSRCQISLLARENNYSLQCVGIVPCSVVKRMTTSCSLWCIYFFSHLLAIPSLRFPCVNKSRQILLNYKINKHKKGKNGIVFQLRVFNLTMSFNIVSSDYIKNLHKETIDEPPKGSHLFKDTVSKRQYFSGGAPSAVNFSPNRHSYFRHIESEFRKCMVKCITLLWKALQCGLRLVSTQKCPMFGSGQDILCV